jgi:hypothetical protein
MTNVRNVVTLRSNAMAVLLVFTGWVFVIATHLDQRPLPYVITKSYLKRTNLSNALNEFLALIAVLLLMGILYGNVVKIAHLISTSLPDSQ